MDRSKYQKESEVAMNQTTYRLEPASSKQQQRQRLNTVWCSLLVAYVSLSSGGCGNGNSRVSGTVSLDGKPMSGNIDHRITVMFVPESGSGAMTVGLVDETGGYELATGSNAGVPPGKYLVSVAAVDVLRPADESSPPGLHRVSPDIYADPTTSGFSADVQPGSNTFDFDLKSQPTG